MSRYEFKVGDIAQCVCPEGWSEMRWYNENRFVVESQDLFHLNNGPFHTDFVLVKKKKIKVKQYGLVKFCDTYYKGGSKCMC